MPPDAAEPRLAPDGASAGTGGALAVGGIPLTALAERYGTPLYVYDAGAMRAAYRALSAALAGFAEVYYSVKANPNPAVVAVFVGAGAGLEVASAAEYEVARAAGAPGSRVLFAGPGKREDELAHALAGGIGEIHLESHEEIGRVAAIARRLGRPAPVALRVNPSAGAQGGAMRMGGKPSPFGFDEEAIDPVLDAVAADPWLDLRGVHLFAGTQILDADVLAGQWAHGLALAARVARRVGPLATIDLGGGLGVPYFAGETPLDLARLAERAAALRETVAADPLLRGSRIVVEPGRYLVGPAGLYAARVVAAKVSRGARFVVVDGGMHHHLAASGNLGQIVKRDYPVVAADGRGRPASPCALVGPLCTPLDTLARAASLPELAAGEVVAVLRSGAYGLTASPLGFLSHPTPAEVLVDGREVREIRPRGTFARPFAAPSPLPAAVLPDAAA